MLNGTDMQLNMYKYNTELHNFQFKSLKILNSLVMFNFFKFVY